jgi:hypothetical protein
MALYMALQVDAGADFTLDYPYPYPDGSFNGWLDPWSALAAASRQLLACARPRLRLRLSVQPDPEGLPPRGGARGLCRVRVPPAAAAARGGAGGGTGGGRGGGGGAEARA